MKEATRQTRPEDHCYVGVGGNPALTKRLQRLASRAIKTTPRPLRTLAFLAETVITDENGPVEMILEGDVGQGSTILAEKSKRSRHKHGIAVVRGITLATLLEETVAMMDDSHLIIKMDVEGAKYAILNKDWQTLCRAVQETKLHISMLLELHGRRKISRSSALVSFHRDKIVRKLVDCGVHIVMDSMRSLVRDKSSRVRPSEFLRVAVALVVDPTISKNLSKLYWIFVVSWCLHGLDPHLLSVLCGSLGSSFSPCCRKIPLVMNTEE